MPVFSIFIHDILVGFNVIIKDKKNGYAAFISFKIKKRLTGLIMQKKFLAKTNKQKLVLLFLILLAISLLVASFLITSRKKPASNTNNNDITKEKPKSEENKQTPPTITTENLNQADKSTQPFEKVSNNIYITKPAAGSKIVNGTEVAGIIGGKTGVLGYKIKSIKGGVITDYLTDIEINNIGQSFNFSVAFEKKPIAEDTGNLEVYLLENNQKVDSVSFEVKF